MAALAVASIILVLFTVFFVISYWKKRGKKKKKKSNSDDGIGKIIISKRRIFRYELLERATNGFCDANKVGEGGFGYVHRGVLLDGKQVAIKQLKAGSRQGEREFQAEADIITTVYHKNLVSLVGYCISATHRILVYEFVPNNTLHFHLHGEGPTIDWPARMKIDVGAAKGLAYLHDDCHPNIIHRNIKAANILLDFNFQVKVYYVVAVGVWFRCVFEVADFGLAKCCCPDVTSADVYTRVMGTAMPLLRRALQSNDFDDVVDPRLQNHYQPSEMARMVACAAASLRYSADHRPSMAQIVCALKGDASQVAECTSNVSSDSEAAQCKQDMIKMFTRMTCEVTG
ncbi:protein kinase superfamily [Stylosanthes scabra]|uniref:non-specific serine/threonine protein kinase n=1 Tax=Stylosanthes scabra TaxID=79078 RepID=A0ABU6V344_9FABA|nr:protein kinase superfamily [Stylosanthes scabra]